MNLHFTKMHGLGNDFIVLNGLERPVALSTRQRRLLADRRFGIGCDQILLLEPSDVPAADVRYRIFNADGAEVAHCGNGVRCAADFLYRHAYVTKDEVLVDTLAGLIRVYREENNLFRVNMGAPRFAPPAIPIRAQERQLEYSLELPGGQLGFYALSMGNAHAVICVDDTGQAQVQALGQALQAHDFFPESVNVGFMQVLDESHIRLRVYERGVGETLACGTGACAAVVAGRLAGKLSGSVDVELPGGHLTVAWAGESQAVWMTGPATTVYEGRINL